MFSRYSEIEQLYQRCNANAVARNQYIQKIKQNTTQRVEYMQKIKQNITQRLKFTQQVKAGINKRDRSSQFIATTCIENSWSTLSSLNEKSGNSQKSLKSEANQSLKLAPLSIDYFKHFCQLVQVEFDLEQQSQELENTLTELNERVQKLEQLRHYLLSRFDLAIGQKKSQMNLPSSEISDESLTESDVNEELEEILILIRKIATDGDLNYL